MLRRAVADAGDVILDLQQRGAGGAEIGVERVEFRLLGLQLRGRGVGFGGRLLRFRREFRQALARSFEPRREFRDDRLQLPRQRLGARAQLRELAVGEIFELQFVVDFDKRRS